MTAITQSVDLDRRGRVAVITVNNPPVNALGQHVRQGLRDGLRQASATRPSRPSSICEGRTFIAGADITEFGKPPQAPGLHDVQDLIESAPKPVVAAIHGTALGGGLEVALACHYRVAVPARALRPAGSQARPAARRRRHAAPAARGRRREGAGDDRQRRSDPGRARRSRPGLVDEIVEGDLRGGRWRSPRRCVAEKRPLTQDPRQRRQGRGRARQARDLRRRSARRTRARSAASRRPRTTSRRVEAAVNLPFDEGMKRERELFQELMTGPSRRPSATSSSPSARRPRSPTCRTTRRPRDDQEGGGDRRRHHGRRHRDELRQRRHPGDDRRDRRRSALDRGLGVIRKNYETHGAARPAHRRETSRSAWA